MHGWRAAQGGAPNLLTRHDTLSDFMRNLRYPGTEFLNAAHKPWIERHPLRF